MKVLLVEDEASIAGFIERGLTAEGWSVTLAADGETALDLLQAQSFDVILLDLVLPGIDGLEVVNALRARGDSTPVLALSALDTDDDRIEALHAFGAENLRKPFDFDVLLARLETARGNDNGDREESRADLTVTGGGPGTTFGHYRSSASSA